MKIGIDARFFNESGVGRYIRNLLKELAEIDQKNEYIIYLLPEDFDSLDLPSNFTKKVAAIPWHSAAEQFHMPKILNGDHLDLMHFPYFSLPIWYKGPYVMTIHDLILHSFPTGKASTKSRVVYYSKWLGYRYIMQQSAKHAKHILTVSMATKKDIVHRLGVSENRITVTYEGVDAALYNGMESNREGDYFLHVGNVYPHKNVERFVKAFALVLKQSEKPVSLVFVGRQDFFFERLKTIIEKLGIEKHVKILGSVSDEELAGLYSHAKATVVPSLMEGFGLPALEAMSRNCLVITSDIPVMREICGEAPIFVDPTSVNAIASAMGGVLIADEKKFESHKKSGLNKVKDFSWRQMAEETLKVYESCNRIRSR